MTPDQGRLAHWHDFVAGARWFGGKGRSFQVTGSRRLEVPGGRTGPAFVAVELLTVRYADGGSEVYQVPVTYSAEPRAELEACRIGHWRDDELGEVVAYDALHDPEAATLWLRGFEADPAGDLQFRRVSGSRPAEDATSPAPPSVLRGEQSNTSVVFGDQLVKVFRKVAPGLNPDIEILSVLSGDGPGASRHIAPLLGWVEATPQVSGAVSGEVSGGPSGELSAQAGEPLHLGIVQQFLRGAEDGWLLALADLAEHLGDSRSSEPAFAQTARLLGAAVTEVHGALAAGFPTASWSAPDLDRLAEAMTQRLEAQLLVVPDLETHAEDLRKVFDRVRQLPEPVTAQRVHGDLHLGQTLRVAGDAGGAGDSGDWRIIDFEGEPATPLAQRRAPDSAMRDVAGMLRSFDYAANVGQSALANARADALADAAANTNAVADSAVGSGSDVGQRARDWAAQVSEAFLAGYTGSDAGRQPDTTLDRTLLRAYEADKAVYEAGYEARNRPSWLPIPLAALSRLTSDIPSGPTRGEA